MLLILIVHLSLKNRLNITNKFIAFTDELVFGRRLKFPINIFPKTLQEFNLLGISIVFIGNFLLFSFEFFFYSLYNRYKVFLDKTLTLLNLDS